MDWDVGTSYTWKEPEACPQTKAISFDKALQWVKEGKTVCRHELTAKMRRSGQEFLSEDASGGRQHVTLSAFDILATDWEIADD